MLLATVDLETLAIENDAVILSCGICLFDDTICNTFDELVSQGVNIYFDQESQIDKQRIVSQSTLEWWGAQGEAAKECLDNPCKTPVRDFHQIFDILAKKMGAGDSPYSAYRKKLKWYARGPHFDIAKMESLFLDFNVTPPWRYYNVRDIRTWLECHGLQDNIKLVKPPTMVAHNSLHDAAFDAWMMQQVLHNKENLVIDESHKR